uniref:NAD(+) kinase n=1 Tax=Rhizophora mucronata TaxID=61149 RepID=A0A2P2P0K5_RHIMU
MVACLLSCQVAMVDVNRLTPVAGALVSPWFCKPSRDSKLVGLRFGSELLRKDRLCKRKLKFSVSAELSETLSLNFGLDSQVIQSHDVSQFPWIGPVPGDIAEVEAYCRIFRAAEWLHAALMDTLCNPLTGECTVSYDFSPEEKPLLEDKIVSVLGCMLSLLNKGREDVLSGRSSIMNSFRGAEVPILEDNLPPLAIFRSEMKRCCESLHVALEDYLTPEDGRSLDVWRKLQRLKNVCYDAGFSRHDDCPSHSLFANWSSVYLSTSKEEVGSKTSGVAFWSGGQVTEEGLNWLLHRGFRTIVDLRAETVKDEFYQAALDNAILSGKIELFKIPIEAKTAPSMAQVEKFASLVSDCGKRPIYLHSKEGAWRTSAMVSRWKQYMNRSACQPTIPLNTVLQETNDLGQLQASSDEEEDMHLEQENELLSEDLDRLRNSNEEGQNIEEAYHGIDSLHASTSPELFVNGVGALTNNYRITDPLNAQVPPCNFFSKAEMSRFFRTRKISPLTYFNCQPERFEKLTVLGEANNGTGQHREIVSTTSVPGFVKVKRTNGSVSAKNLPMRPQNSPASFEKHLNGSDSVSVALDVKTVDPVEKCSVSGTYVSTAENNRLRNHVASQPMNEHHKNSNVGLSSSDDDLDSIEGDMCASSTGVVRVQSRRKAEMFLVRTDGFSCTREKVTESSLAFTHPSTQQQMLMWKSTPKTVLLLKKLGPELMEQAKEVASFLYHQEKMNVLVEPDVHDIFARIPGFGFVQTFYSQDTSDLHERVDFVACLGGDGVILHASNLFRGAVPPVVSFNLGSLGFLTSHSFEDCRQDLKQVIHGNSTLDGVYITLRMRLRCEIFRNGKAMPGKVFDVLNEIVVDRGSNPYLSKIECYEHNRLITKVQGDGVIVATPTGSTAYSTAAGGSMVHPNVPCMLFTPICPHSLSFRPVILPDSAKLELKIPEDARSNAWVSFDGKRRQQLSRGDSVQISMSEHPLPTVNKCDQTGDWFRSLICCLNWNERLDQRAL